MTSFSSRIQYGHAAFAAMGTAGPLEPFLTLAEAHLRQAPDSWVGALMVERLFATGRYGEIGGLVRQYPWLTRCTDRVTCLAGLQVARSWFRTGSRAEARELLRSASARMNQLGLGGLRRLAATRTELTVR